VSSRSNVARYGRAQCYVRRPRGSAATSMSSRTHPNVGRCSPLGRRCRPAHVWSGQHASRRSPRITRDGLLSTQLGSGTTKLRKADRERRQSNRSCSGFQLTGWVPSPHDASSRKRRYRGSDTIAFSSLRPIVTASWDRPIQSSVEPCRCS